MAGVFAGEPGEESFGELTQNKCETWASMGAKAYGDEAQGSRKPAGADLHVLALARTKSYGNVTLTVPNMRGLAMGGSGSS